MNEYPTRFCINCHHYDTRSNVCGSQQSIRHVNPVSGKTLYESATVMRANQGMCGLDAILFIPRIDAPTGLSRTLQRIKNAFK
jgi:hypothetical protein